MVETIIVIGFVVIMFVVWDILISGRYSPFLPLSKDDMKIKDDLIESGAYKTARVILPNCVSKDDEEILNSDKFKELQEKADRLVNKNVD